MNFNPYKRKIDRYLAKNFLIRFAQIIGAFALLIFFVNILETIDKTSAADISFFSIALMAFYQVPDFINDIAPSIILFSAIATFFFLSIKSEITVIRSSGFSLWHAVLPIASTAFLLGIFWVVIFSPLSILMAKNYNHLESLYVKKESRDSVEVTGGIWLKQPNLEKQGEEIIIQAKKVYKENIELNNVTIWFFDKKGKFYKKIDSKKALLSNNIWHLKNVIINDENLLNSNGLDYKIPTNLEADFIVNKIVSNFQNVKLFSIFELPELINSLKMAGFQSAKFEVYFNSLLTKPILFASMVLIACFFGINNFRSQMGVVMIFVGVIFGLALYITLSLIAALGSSRFMPVFASTWVVTFICLAIGVLLVYRKETI